MKTFGTRCEELRRLPVFHLGSLPDTQNRPTNADGREKLELLGEIRKAPPLAPPGLPINHRAFVLVGLSFVRRRVLHLDVPMDECEASEGRDVWGNVPLWPPSRIAVRSTLIFMAGSRAKKTPRGRPGFDTPCSLGMRRKDRWQLPARSLKKRLALSATSA